MAFRKCTSIVGQTATGEIKAYLPHGHWKLESAIRYARRYGIVGEIDIKYTVIDTSGHGRGGHDGRWVVDANDIPTKKASWSEYGKEHA